MNSTIKDCVEKIRAIFGITLPKNSNEDFMSTCEMFQNPGSTTYRFNFASYKKNDGSFITTNADGDVLLVCIGGTQIKKTIELGDITPQISYTHYESNNGNYVARFLLKAA